MKRLLLLILLLAFVAAERSWPKSRADCPPNSTYMTCQSSTRATCENPKPTGFTKDCVSRCVCYTGFVEKNNRCIQLKEC